HRVECADHQLSFDGFVGDLCNITHGILHLSAVAAVTGSSQMHHTSHQRCNQQEYHAQAPVHPEKHRQQSHYGQAFTQHHGNGVGRCAFNLCNIVGDFGNQTTNAVLVVITHRHLQQLIKNLLTHLDRKSTRLNSS